MKAKYQLARFIKRTKVKRAYVYDRRDACVSGLWLHTWHMNAEHEEHVVRTKYASSAVATRAFRAFVRTQVDAGYELQKPDYIGWTINPRGLRGYHHGNGTWGWPQKWRADVTVEIVK